LLKKLDKKQTKSGMKMKTKILVIMLLACTSQSVAAKLYRCVDVAGKTAYQDSPCAELPTDKANYPIVATQITEKIAQDTVAKFYAAISKRDSAAATKFVAQKFSMSKASARGRVVDGSAFFATLIGDMVRATKNGDTTNASCNVLKATTDAVTLACTERSKRNSTSVKESTAEFTVKIVDGAARFTHLTIDQT
jgi:hypothetical protein